MIFLKIFPIFGGLKPESVSIKRDWKDCIRGGGTPKPGIIFCRVGPLYYRLPLLSECSQNPSASVYQLALLWEAAFGSSEFFWRLFQRVCPSHDRWFTSAPAHTKLSVQQFLTKNGMTPCPTLPIHLISPLERFLFFWMKKVLKGKSFADVEEVKQKTAEAKRHQNWQVQKTVLSSGQKSLGRCIAANGEYFEGDWSLNMEE